MQTIKKPLINMAGTTMPFNKSNAGQVRENPQQTQPVSPMPTNSNGLMSMSRASEPDMRVTEQQFTQPVGAPQMRTTSQPATATPAQASTGSPSAQSPAAVTGPTALPQRYNPTEGRVADNALVENRIQGLMNLDNPLMKKSIINANNISAQRGLQSSSIATENAVNSMFNFATPIAQQDAQTMAQQGFVNQEQRQQIGMEDNRALNQGILNNRQNEFVADQSQRDRDLSVEIEGLRNQNALGQLDREGQIRLEQMEVQNQFTAEQSGLDRAFTTEIEGLRYQNSLGLLDREGQLRLEQMEVQNNFTAGQSALDRNFTKELEGLRYQNSRGLISLEGQQRLQQMEVQNRFTSSENTVQREFTRELEDLKNQSNLGLLDKEGQQRLDQLDKQNEFAEKQMSISSNLQTKRDEMLQGFQQDNMTIESVSRLELLEAQARETQISQDNQNNFARQMEYSNSISAAVNRGIEALGNAMMNPEITPAQHQSISDNINRMVQGQIANFQDVYNIRPAAGGTTGPNTSPNTGTPPSTNNPPPSANNPAKPIGPSENFTQPVMPGGGGGRGLMNNQQFMNIR